VPIRCDLPPCRYACDMVLTAVRCDRHGHGGGASV
jgi:hypothetical protein